MWLEVVVVTVEVVGVGTGVMGKVVGMVVLEHATLWAFLDRADNT